MDRWFFRILLWCACADWLIFLRGMLAPSVLFVLCLITLARLLLVTAWPEWNFLPFLTFSVPAAAAGRYSKSLSLKARREREHYLTPDTGFPWPSFLTGPRPRPLVIGSFVLEPLTAALLAVLIGLFAAYASYHDLYRVYEQFFILPIWASGKPRLRDAVIAPTAPLVISCLGLFLYNWYEWRILHPRAPKPRVPKEEDFFPAVDAGRMRVPDVPSVQALARHFSHR